MIVPPFVAYCSSSRCSCCSSWTRSHLYCALTLCRQASLHTIIFEGRRHDLLKTHFHVSYYYLYTKKLSWVLASVLETGRRQTVWAPPLQMRVRDGCPRWATWRILRRTGRECFPSFLHTFNLLRTWLWSTSDLGLVAIWLNCDSTCHINLEFL